MTEEKTKVKISRTAAVLAGIADVSGLRPPLECVAVHDGFAFATDGFFFLAIGSPKGIVDGPLLIPADAFRMLAKHIRKNPDGELSAEIDEGVVRLQASGKKGITLSATFGLIAGKLPTVKRIVNATLGDTTATMFLDPRYLRDLCEALVDAGCLCMQVRIPKDDKQHPFLVLGKDVEGKSLVGAMMGMQPQDDVVPSLADWTEEPAAEPKQEESSPETLPSS